MPYKMIQINTTYIAARLRKPFTHKRLKAFQRDKLNCYKIIDLSSGRTFEVGGACRR